MGQGTKAAKAAAASKAAAMLGQRGGSARAKALTAARRTEIAKAAATARWGPRT